VIIPFSELFYVKISPGCYFLLAVTAAGPCGFFNPHGPAAISTIGRAGDSYAASDPMGAFASEVSPCSPDGAGDSFFST
jgi:hypothetical protein